jgi:hypothetical protein
VVPKVCSADLRGISGYISAMAALKGSFVFNLNNNILLKIIKELL